MTITTDNNGNTIITAAEGMFLKKGNCYGISILLGVGDTPESYEELPMSEFPVVEEPAEMETPDGVTAEEMAIYERIKAMMANK